MHQQLALAGIVAVSAQHFWLMAARNVPANQGHHRRLLKLGLLILLVIGVIVVAIAVRSRRRQRKHRPSADSDTRIDEDHDVHQVSNAVIAASHISKVYEMGRITVTALNDVSLSIDEGGIVCIMGKSGSGKSTLLRQLGLIDQPTSGKIFLFGKDVSAISEDERTDLRLRALGYVFQDYALLPELTAAENVSLPALMAGMPRQQMRSRAAELLEIVGLGARASHSPRELSGGEQQRVAIARALMNEPRIIYADEPTANLDTASSRTVMETLKKLNDLFKVTVVFVSQDPADVHYATRVVQLEDGKMSGANS